MHFHCRNIGVIWNKIVKNTSKKNFPTYTYFFSRYTNKMEWTKRKVKNPIQADEWERQERKNLATRMNDKAKRINWLEILVEIKKKKTIRNNNFVCALLVGWFLFYVNFLCLCWYLFYFERRINWVFSVLRWFYSRNEQKKIHLFFS